MDENLPTPIDDEAWQDEIRHAQKEREQKSVAPPVVDERKSLVKLLAKGILIGLLTLCLLFAWVYADNALLPFDAAAWKTNVNREKQIGRLRRQVKLVGMSRQDVLQKLGNPDESDDNRLVYITQKSGDASRLLVIELKNERVAGSHLSTGAFRNEQSQRALERR